MVWELGGKLDQFDELARTNPIVRRMLKWRENKDGFIIKEIFFDKDYEQVKPVREGDVVVDAGAHIGVFTVKASLQAGEKGKVYAFEPEPENFSYLSLNTKGLENVEIFNMALWSSEGFKTLYYAETNLGGHSLFPLDKYNDGKIFFPVQTTRLDSVVKRKVDFFKIDVELSELEVLKGAKHILQHYEPFIALEIHTKELAKNVKSFLSKYRYKLEQSRPSWIYYAIKI